MTHPTHHDHVPDDGSPDDPQDETLRTLVARAGSLPTLRPSRDLWPEIAARLDAAPASARAAHLDPVPRAPAGPELAGARVLPFRVPRVARSERAPWLAAAAVTLMAVSSGATYLALRRPAAEPNAVAGSAFAVPSVTVAAARRDTQRAPDEPGSTEAVPSRPEPRERAADRGEARTEARSAARWSAGPVDRGVPGAVDYDREIADLRVVVSDRRGELDSATVDVLTRNLRIIDAAIAASRAALAHDPRSPFLGEQLTRALGQKVELLRTAALLSHT